LTGVEAQRAALRVLGIIAVGAGMALVSLAVIGTVVPQVALIAIPCALFAMGTLGYSATLNDYENPEELERFQRDAARMSLESVVSTHGWKNVLRWGILSQDQFATKFRQHLQDKNLVQIMDYYENVTRQIAEAPYVRYDYQIPNPREYRGQWRTETATITFEELIQRYSLDKLERYGIVETGEMHSLRDLSRDYEAIRINYTTRVAQVEREFAAITEGFRRTREATSAAANQLYNGNWAVTQLNNIETRNVREREAVLNGAQRRKDEAQGRYNRCIMSLTNNGQIPYERLSPREQGVYNQQNVELQVARATADNEARQQIAHINTRYVIERSSLNAEESRVRNERNQLLRAAQETYDRDIAPHNQRRINTLQPIEAAFRSSVNDINGRYRAYLRTVH
jgi:hypothetical protein